MQQVFGKVLFVTLLAGTVGTTAHALTVAKKEATNLYAALRKAGAGVQPHGAGSALEVFNLNCSSGFMMHKGAYTVCQFLDGKTGKLLDIRGPDAQLLYRALLGAGATKRQGVEMASIAVGSVNCQSGSVVTPKPVANCELNTATAKDAATTDEDSAPH